ncbi:MAG: Rpp14/Pop5 family protein, partial [Candidatus Micrarchaeota archaeon]|nr:Rpp14/Pop5 family protein [Candidatus Micrarchaeota archaeon]
MILKRKNRYVLIEASKPLDATDRDTWSEIRAEMLKFLGEKAYVDANPFLVGQVDGSRFIFRVSRNTERQVILALAFIKRAKALQVGFYTLKTSGTIKAL